MVVVRGGFRKSNLLLPGKSTEYYERSRKINISESWGSPDQKLIKKPEKAEREFGGESGSGGC